MNSNFSGLLMAFLFFLSFLGSIKLQAQTTNGPLYYYLTNYEGHLVADTDPTTLTGDSVVLNDNVIIAEGQCSKHETFFIYARDTQGQLAMTPTGLSVAHENTSPFNNPLSFFSRNSYSSGISTALFLNIEWVHGDNYITIRNQDGDTLLQLSQALPTPDLPEIKIIAPDTVILGACSGQVRFEVMAQLNATCSNRQNHIAYLSINSGELTVVSTNSAAYQPVDYELMAMTAGVHNLQFTYTTEFGQEVVVDKQIVVLPAAEPLPQIRFGSQLQDTLVVKPCRAQSVLTILSFVVRDDCLPLDVSGIQFDGGGSGLPNLNGSGFSVVRQDRPGELYLEVTGPTLTPGQYTLSVSYGGVTTTRQLVVVEGSASYLELLESIGYTNDFSLDSDYEITCIDHCVVRYFSVQFSTECGLINRSTFNVHLDGVRIIEAFINIGAGYFEYVHTFCVSDTGTHTLSFEYTVQGLFSDETYELEVPLIVSFTGNVVTPFIIPEPDTLTQTLNTCIGQPANQWLHTGWGSACENTNENTLQVSSNARVIPVTPGLDLVQASEPGLYEITRKLGTLSTPLAQDTVLFEVIEAEAAVLTCQPNITLPLGEADWAELTPEMVLGASAGCLSINDYVVRVLDGQSDNLGQIDGCGSYTYEVYAPNQVPTQGFVGVFSAENWALRTPAQGSVTFGPQQMNIALAARQDYAALAYTFGAAGEWATDYQYLPLPNGAALQFRLLDAAGQLLASWESANQGSLTRQVEAGQTLLLYLSANAAGAVPLSLTLSNWQFTPTNPGAPICTGMVIAEDTTPPTTALVEEAEVVLDPLGLAQLATSQLDAGSVDNCGGVSQQVRRQYTRDPLSCAPVAPYYGPWAETVDFDCCDACEEVVVEVRTLDDAGLESTASTSVFVRDDRQPIITAFDIEPACCPNPEACQGAFQYSFRVEAACSVRRPAISVALDLNADGSPDADLTAVTVPQPNNRYKITGWVAPEGQHALLLRAVDGCGNITTATVPFQVLDCSGGAPPIIMLSGGGQGLPEGIDQPLLLPGEPNPFIDQTTIRYWLPAEGEVQLRVVDANGRQVLRRASAHDAGWQSHLPTASELPAAGIYTLELYYHGQVLRQRVAKL